MEENEKIYTPARIKEERESLAKSYLLPAIGASVFAAAFYWLAVSLEDGSGPSRVNALAYAFYELLGKVNGTIFFASIGLLLLLLYIYKMLVLQKKINNRIT